ncbi:MAG TPA: hypothetical protein VMO17_21825 [Terriglobia bacterium]|nr:hypothetical protein [Terriglobia bacterium]
MEEKPQSVRTGGGGGSAKRVAAGLEDGPSRQHHMIPVWFFVGVILLIYGLIIFATGIYEFSRPPLEALANLPPAARHPSIWWGALLTVIGGIYVASYMPKKS